MDVSAVVIGTVFMDCKGFAKGNYNPDGRNLGNIKFVHGGVGRNVVENLAGMGLYTYFATTVDRSGVGKEILARLTKNKVDTTFVSEVDSRGMGLWLAIMNERGDLAGSVSQMPDLVYLENYIAEQGAEIIRKCSHVVLELDLNEHITRKVISLAREFSRPVYGIPGNLAVIMAHPDILAGVDCFVCNNIEAERLIGKTLDIANHDRLLHELAAFVTASGLGSMVITLGGEGCIYYDSRTSSGGYQPVFPVTVIDTTGAGDAFFSGTAMGLMRGCQLKDAVIFGTKVASWTIQSDENTCRDLAAKMAGDTLFSKVI